MSFLAYWDRKQSKTGRLGRIRRRAEARTHQTGIYFTQPPPLTPFALVLVPGSGMQWWRNAKHVGRFFRRQWIVSGRKPGAFAAEQPTDVSYLSQVVRFAPASDEAPRGPSSEGGAPTTPTTPTTPIWRLGRFPLASIGVRHHADLASSQCQTAPYRCQSLPFRALSLRFR